MPKTIDLTPTWEEAMRVYAFVLRDGEPEGKRIAFEEIVKAGSIIDALQAEIKELKEEKNKED